MSSSNCCFLTCIQISQEAGQVVWYSHLFQNFPQFIVIHIVKGFGIVNKAEIDVFLELSCFSMIQWMLAIWSVVPLAFLKPQTTDWFQIGKGVRQGCILSPCLFNFHAEYIMRNAGLEEAQAGIKIASRNINNLIHADDTTHMVESEEELNSLLMKVKKESENASLKLNIKKMKIMASGPITSWQIDGETM